MSIISAVCADADLAIIKKAIARAKDQARKQFVADEFGKVTTILNDLLKYCEERICE